MLPRMIASAAATAQTTPPGTLPRVIAGAAAPEVAVSHAVAILPEPRPVSAPAPVAPHMEPVDIDALFDEFSDRLEEAAGQLGIEPPV